MTRADVIVSRKTARDGKLEIPPALAAAVSALPPAFAIRIGERAGAGMLVSMECSCQGAGERHRHHFLQAEGLKELAAESPVAVAIVGGGVTVTPSGQRGSTSLPA